MQQEQSAGAKGRGRGKGEGEGGRGKHSIAGSWCERRYKRQSYKKQPPKQSTQSLYPPLSVSISISFSLYLYPCPLFISASLSGGPRWTQLTIFIANAAINFKTPFAKHHMGSRKLKINFKAAIYDLWA